MNNPTMPVNDQTGAGAMSEAARALLAVACIINRCDLEDVRRSGGEDFEAGIDALFTILNAKLQEGRDVRQN